MISISPSLVDQTLDLACAIQQIPAPTFQEEQRAAYLFEQFNQLGLKDVQRDAAGNVLARIPGLGSERPLIVSAHLDTVHPITTSLILKREKERITGPGIGDNSLGLATLLALGRLLWTGSPRLSGDVWLVANVGEEGLGNLRGMQAVVDRFGGEPLAYFVVEGMGLGNVLHRGLGVERYRIMVQTPGGHSWVDFGEPSAIHELCALVTRLAAISLPQQPCTTLNVGIIHGGNSVNSIAAQAWIELDLRSEDSGALASLVHKVQNLVRGAQKINVVVSMDQIGKRNAGALSEEHWLIQMAANTLRSLGQRPNLEIASTDANLPLSRGYPAVCVGITNGSNAHTPEEYILTGPVAQGLTQVYRMVTEAWEQASQ